MSIVDCCGLEQKSLCLKWIILESYEEEPTVGFVIVYDVSVDSAESSAGSLFSRTGL